SPMQESCEPVAEIKPLEKSHFDQREVDQAVKIPLLGIQTSVKPDSPPGTDAPVNKWHLVIEPAELRNPYVTISLKQFRHLRRVDGIDSRNARHLSVDERRKLSVIRNFIPVRLIKYMLQIQALPPSLLQMRAERCQKPREKGLHTRIIGRQRDILWLPLDDL